MSDIANLSRQFPADKYILLAIPAEMMATEHTFPDPVVVSVNVDAIYGDVHRVDGKLRLGRPALDRIAHALGIVFNPEKTKVNKLSPVVWIGRAEAARRTVDGWSVRSSEYEWDAELHAKIDAKGDERKEMRYLATYQADGRSRAEIGAMSRVIRALTGLKTSYSKEELMKPLVFVRHVLRTAPAKWPKTE